MDTKLWLRQREWIHGAYSPLKGECQSIVSTAFIHKEDEKREEKASIYSA
jgi:hypothetical protein